VNPQGCETTYTFKYGLTTAYGSSITGTAGSGGFGGGGFSTHVSNTAFGLQPSTTYHFRLYATNSGGTSQGLDRTFTTGAAAPTCSKPTVLTEPATFVMSDKAFLNGTVKPNGCTASYTIEYGLAATGTYSKLTGTVGNLGPFSVSREAVGLQANKLYTYRIWASNTAGRTDGSWVNFETKPKYVALGDSYSSGTGTGTNYEPKNLGECRRTVNSYPYLLHNAHPDWGFVNMTCHGAKTEDLLLSQIPSLTEDTTWVTYTVGGNDAGFREVIEECYPPETTNCLKRIDIAQTFITDNLPALLEKVNNKIKLESPYAKVLVLDYPRVFNNEDCNIVTFFDEVELTRLNKTSEMLKEVLNAATTKAGANFTFLDVMPSFNGHAVCDPPGTGEGAEWINGASLPTPESYHPKIEGHANAYYPLVHKVTG
jgi:lysophospholipase L1-like esterase